MKRIIFTCVTSLLLSPVVFATPTVTLSGPTPAISPSYPANSSTTITYTVSNYVPQQLPLSISGISSPIQRVQVPNDCGYKLPPGNPITPATCQIGVSIAPTTAQIGASINQILAVDYQGRAALTSPISFNINNSSNVPQFLVTVRSPIGANVNIFPIDPNSGALGSPITNSPFDMGLEDSMTIATHPNGRFTYVADGNDGSIHMLNVDPTTGIPTEIAPAITNESGSFFEPAGTGDSPTKVITITPDGKYLYATNNDAMVSAYSIGAGGALTFISNVDVGACSTGAITANNNFVWVTDTCSGTGPWHVMTAQIETDGSLTYLSTVVLTDVYSWLWSIAVSPDGQFIQVGDDGGDAQVYSFTVGINGALTQVGARVVLTDSSDCRYIAYSPDGKFFYASDDASKVHAVAQNSDGSITEIPASPYTTSDSGYEQIIVDKSGQFVYVGGLIITGFTRNLSTGALTLVNTAPSGPLSADNLVAVGLVYNTGS